MLVLILSLLCAIMYFEAAIRTRKTSKAVFGLMWLAMFVFRLVNLLM